MEGAGAGAGAVGVVVVVFPGGVVVRGVVLVGVETDEEGPVVRSANAK